MPAQSVKSTRTVIATHVRPRGPGPRAGSPGTGSAGTIKAGPRDPPLLPTSKPHGGGGGGNGPSMTTTRPPADPSPHDLALIQAAQARTVFPALLAEGDALTRQGHFAAATSLYTRALEICPFDATALATRSRCYILQGNDDLALADAHGALKSDPHSSKAQCALADALFNRGDFEEALLMYHRGNHARPDLDEFTTGIARATQAICSAVAGIDPAKLKAQRAVEMAQADDPKTGLGLPPTHQKTRPRLATAHHPGAVGRNLSSNALRRSTGPVMNTTTITRRGSTPSHPSTTTPTSPTPQPREILERNLLEELYDDHTFLLALASDASLMAAAGGDVGTCVADGCRYMQARLEYWRVRNPTGRPASATVSALARLRLAGKNNTKLISARDRTSTVTVSTPPDRNRPGAATPARRTRDAAARQMT
ncbi:hypothetical protein PhCBS80983_g03918 [Powellomyces hirtus]|uniref:Outer dynein arm-docking complex subunit 4 n=1 Tax=Powellomyces hirtus TaxID=109895 RepID=A0A507E0N5_9FUNG|nr:hypothetical protein PhCBS80983_g03918 [Powellomyces hirtus]